MNTDDLLDRVIEIVLDRDVNVRDYTFALVDGATQATVWAGTSTCGGPDLALRLTPKPTQLITRIAALVDGVTDVVCPRTLAVGHLLHEGRLWTVHLCTWIGTGIPRSPDLWLLGQHLARLHLDLAESTVDVTDRSLTFEPIPAPEHGHGLPKWIVAQEAWRDRIHAWRSNEAAHPGSSQAIHGDMHRGNIVAVSGGFGFIDFDKVMHTAPVFDLAKLFATDMFVLIGGRARFQTRRAAELLAGYESLRPLSEEDLAVLEGLMVLLIGETARRGGLTDDAVYRCYASAVADWWIRRRQRAFHDPLGIRRARRSRAPSG
jgi:hypothetical protein